MSEDKEPFCGWNYFMEHQCNNCTVEVECLKYEKKQIFKPKDKYKWNSVCKQKRGELLPNFKGQRK